MRPVRRADAFSTPHPDAPAPVNYALVRLSTMIAAGDSASVNAPLVPSFPMAVAAAEWNLVVDMLNI
jgi:hypothetical protein